MRTLAVIVFGFAAIILHTVLAPYIDILGARPDFLVLLVAYTALVLGARHAAIAGFITGLIIDSQTPGYLGLNALALSVTGYATARTWDHLVRANVLVHCSVLFFATLLRDAIYYLIRDSQGVGAAAGVILRHSLLGALYTAAIGGAMLAIWRARGGEGLAGDVRA
jgi:rod shape-determining protein MreD